MTLIKALYVRKYYNRETEALPHKNIGDNVLAKSVSGDEFFEMDNFDHEDNKVNESGDMSKNNINQNTKI